jgi:glycosyltransferase involved in cell wall biosynthesis
MRTLVIVPTYDEASTIEDILPRIRTALPDAEVLVVDDGSPDGTADLAEKMATALGGIHVMRRVGRLGLGSAYRDGYTWGLSRGVEVFLAMDADLSHDPAMLPVLRAQLDCCDVVIGSRYIPGGSIPDWAWHRRILSEAGNRYSSWMLGLPIHDLTSGFRAYRAGILRSIDLREVRADGYGFQIEMSYRAAQAGARITEIPICFVDRQFGKSKMSAKIILEALLMVTEWGIARRLPSLARRTGQIPPGG